MILKWRISILLLFLTVLALGSLVLAGSLTEGWSPEESALAKQLGITLHPKVGTFRILPLGDQTWFSLAVLEGVVQTIETDPYGFYHTKVHVHVDRHLKGTSPLDVLLCFTYGPAYSQRYGMVETHETPSIKFSTADVGKRFVLFLNRARAPDPNPRKFRPGEANEFYVVNRYLVHGGVVHPDPEFSNSTGSYRYDEAIEQILRVAEPQARLMHTKP